MATKPTLLVLAAGMGSRYGGLKQMDGVGPNNEAILDYSVYDAIRAGFGKVVFVIRHDFEENFKKFFNEEKFGGKIKVDYVFQELNMLPDGFAVPAERQKPWGTNHAIMMASKSIKEPFAVINADDFYGQDSYRVLAEHLSSAGGTENNYYMVGYYLKNTLSDFGTVSRGVCSVDRNGNLTSMVERTAIERIDDKICYKDGDSHTPLEDQTLVSMNMFGFTPDYFRYSLESFKDFLRENISNLKSEFYIPSMVNRLVGDGTAKMKVLSTDSQWFGVTYQEDKATVVSKIKSLIEAGEYPEQLWK